MSTRQHSRLPGADVLFRGGNGNALDEIPKAPKRIEKITVYFTPAELAEIDAARLELREQMGGRVDRGRLLRCAFLLAMKDHKGLERALMRGDGA